ncbi:MAG: hypothetical protein DWQ47_07330 [Acidobacteria bacterium]|nr:MAG: hypothetical protein DWQ32_15430 [Acidobacteriota bacterium]REJ99263.1 MAG: hypothetical protein DWQ38_14545 [Acidobacteriota bacterium]REK16016.1 MAG: hypothetical protein DWQ43_03140 [Acidobacteriota bacterium]REK43697.1 MAG: hypothetical protein DWQ47_07330 [Acidobacteriota bacterium]
MTRVKVKGRSPIAFAAKTRSDFSVCDLDHRLWLKSEPSVVDSYWSGEKAPESRSFESRFVWSEEFLYVRFDCEQHEPLVIQDAPDVTRKTYRLWEKDVCEVFIAPDPKSPENYFEFEVAPTGEWLDLKIQQKPDERITDRSYTSGMEAAARIGTESVILAIKVPWTAFGTKPSAGDRWRMNVFRLVGSGDSRGYLAWSPTMTEIPNFHVPEKFGELSFM